MEVGDGDPCSSKDSRVIGVLETMEVPENDHIGIGASPLKMVTGSIAQLKCIYANAFSMGNKQEELEAIVQQENYEIVAITENSRMTCTTGVLQWMARNSSEGIDKEGEVVG